jgi:L-aminopeptidase/D-esterase-like protein
MGYAACEASFETNDPRSGSVGSGTGATVGKAAGLALAQKAGIGYAAVQMGPLQIGVAVVLNSYGDIFYRGKKIAGMQSDEADSYTTLLQTAEENLFISTPSGTTNTTLVALFTNGDFTPAQLKHLSQMASAGLARSISPAFTTADGDTVYAISVGPDEEKVPANLNAVGALLASLVEEAIADAVYSAGPLLLR